MKEEIQGWLHSQHEWLQEAALRILNQGNLRPGDVDDLVNLIKSPSASADGKRKFPTAGSSGSNSNLRLISIGPVVGIDALAPRKPLEFGSGNLVVVYGKNGAGKSGYTRIISKACGKPHSTDLKSNVYKPSPAESKCTFKYQFDGVEKEFEWLANSDPVDELQYLDVFDSDSGRLYLEKDREISYAPPELALFAGLVDACKLVEAALTSEQSKLVSTLPKLPGQFGACSVAGRYQDLQSEIKTGKLTELTTWSPDDDAALAAQQERLKIKDPAGAARKRREVKAQIDGLLASLRKGVKALGDDALTALRKLSVDASEKRKAATEGAKALGDICVLEGIGSATWRAMWEAARAYSIDKGYPGEGYPFTTNESRCVLCHQELDDEARRRLDGFESFVKGKLESDADAAEKQLKECLGWLPARPTSEFLATTCQAADLPEGMPERLGVAWDLLESELAELRQGKIPADPPLIDEVVVTVGKKLVAFSEAAEAAAKDFDNDAKSPDRIEAAKKQTELEARKWVAQQGEAVQSEIKRLEKVSQFAAWKRKTTTNSISLQAGRISQELVTDSYIARFNHELRKLGAHRIEVELVKAGASLGRSKHRVRLKGLVVEGAKISDILSEGERRMVALASFLADVTGREGSSPFVFDDPISSLDQDFEECVIARLVELSQTRQVLVFTHRMSFLGIMTDLAGKELHDVHISREYWGAGEPGGVPIFAKNPEGSLKNLKNDRLVRAAKLLKEEGSETYYPLAKAICSDFRVLLERIVEKHLLGGVIQRHSREVHTKVMWVLLKVRDTDCALIDELMTKYSKFEHSQSSETPVELPEPAELEVDINRVLDWLEEFKKRKSGQ